MLFFLSFTVAMLLVVQEALSESPTDISETLDSLIKNLKSNLSTVDPLKMDSTEIWLGSQKVTFYDGELRGMSTLKLTGNCTMMSTNNQEGKLTVKARVGMDHTTTRTRVKSWPSLPGSEFILRAVTDLVDTELDIRVDVSGAKMIPEMHSFKLVEMRGLKMWREEGGVVDIFLNPFIEAFTKIFNKFVQDSLQTQMRPIAVKLVQKMKDMI